MAIVDGSILTAADLAGITTLNGGWTSYTPTWTNLTVGNGTNLGSYIQFGKTVLCRIQLTFGSTTSVSGVFGASIPVSGATTYSATLPGFMLDTSGTAYVPCSLVANVATIVSPSGRSSATVPWTWTTGDLIVINGSYQSV